MLRFVRIVAILLLSATSFSLEAAPKKKISSIKEFVDSIEGSIPLHMQWDEPITFQGFLDPGGVHSNSSSPMYVDTGVGPAGPALQLLAQSIFTSSARNKKYTKAQEQADQILSAYTEQLQGLSVTRVFELAKSKADELNLPVVAYDRKDIDHKHYLKMNPVFLLAQDQRSLMLKNTFEVWSKKRRKKPLFKQEFIVVSENIDAQEPAAYWTQAGEDRLLNLSLSLFQESIDLFVTESKSTQLATGPQRTFKYHFGGKSMFERAYPAEFTTTQMCNAQQLITLRGSLMSIRSTGDEC